MEICYFEDILPPEVKQIIFSYLNLSDLIALSLVCKSFNEFIGQSHECMKKIWIKFYSFKLKELECLKLSVRNYEKLKVNRVKNDDHIKFLTHLQQPWRKVLIYNSDFKRIERYLNFMETFSESIEELEISDIEILNNDHQICSMKFPNLKRIMFRNVPSTAIELFLGTNKKLENASFDIVQVIDGKMPLDQSILNFLENNTKLKHLQLGPHFIKSHFDAKNTKMNFDFKLSKLLLKFPIIRDPSPEIGRNLSIFLSHQPRIDWILFWELESDEILSTAWNKIPALNHVSFIGLENLFDDSMDLTLDPNMNIRHMELLSRKILISQLRKLFIAAPNLAILHVHTLTRYIMEFTARNHRLLKTLRFEYIDEDVHELYNQLKASSDDINRSINLEQFSFWHDAANPFSVDPTFWHT